MAKIRRTKSTASPMPDRVEEFNANMRSPIGQIMQGSVTRVQIWKSTGDTVVYERIEDA